MKINYFKDENLSENYIDLHYRQMDNEVMWILDYLKTLQTSIGKKENEQKVEGKVKEGKYEEVSK